jgi:hypothetical protein
MVANVGTLTVRRQIGISLIEVITAIAILAVGIWAIVTLFPRGQDIIRRSGLRQQATQLAHEAISDFLADPAKMPFAIVPFNPADPQIANRPVLLEPADLLTVRRTYNFVWGEPLDDGLPLGDPNKRVGLVQVGNQWRAILRFAPARIYPAPLPLRNFQTPPTPRVYREVFYDKLPDPDPTNRYDRPSADFHYIVNADPAETVIGLPTQGDYPRLIRVTYEASGQVVSRRPFYVQNGIIEGLPPQTIVREVVEEFPIPFTYLGNGVLVFSESMPAPPGVGIDQLGPLRADYLIEEDLDGDGRFAEDPIDGQDNDGDGRIDEDPRGPWIVETGTTFDPDPTLKAQGVSSVFQTTFGGMTNFQTVYLMPNKDDDGDGRFDEDLPDGSNNDGDDKVDEDPKWGDVLAPIRSDLQSGLFSFILPVGTRLRVAYRAGDDPGTPVDESWFLQVIKPPDDFQLLTKVHPSRPHKSFPPSPLSDCDGLRSAATCSSGNSYRLLAGLNVQVRYRNSANELFTEVQPIAGDGSLRLNGTPARIEIEEVRGASLLVRVSGGSMWRQSPPKTRADYVELATIVPPPAKLTQP